MCMCALQGQQAHSPGQSAAAPREYVCQNPRALKGQKHNRFHAQQLHI